MMVVTSCFRGSFNPARGFPQEGIGDQSVRGKRQTPPHMESGADLVSKTPEMPGKPEKCCNAAPDTRKGVML